MGMKRQNSNKKLCTKKKHKKFQFYYHDHLYYLGNTPFTKKKKKNSSPETLGSNIVWSCEWPEKGQISASVVSKFHVIPIQKRNSKLHNPSWYNVKEHYKVGQKCWQALHSAGVLQKNGYSPLRMEQKKIAGKSTIQAHNATSKQVKTLYPSSQWGVNEHKDSEPIEMICATRISGSSGITISMVLSSETWNQLNWEESQHR